jgi:superkiller protein 3
VKLETISGAELDRAWKGSQALTGVLLGTTVEPGEWHDRMAGVFEATKRWTAVTRHLSRLIEIRPDSVSARERRARAYVELSQVDRELEKAYLDQAMQDLIRVSQLDPNNGRAYAQRARIHLGQNEFAQADEYFTKAIKLTSDEKENWSGRADARARRNQTEAAIADYQEALRLDPEDGPLHAKIADAYYSSKSWKKAAEEYEQAAARSPYNLKLREHLAATLFKLERTPRAIQEYVAVARQYKAQWQFGDAEIAYKKALDLKPEDHLGQLHAELAETCSRLGHLDDTIKEYAKAVKIEPSEWTHWRGLATAHRMKREWAEAKLAYSKAIELHPRDITLIEALARVHSQLKEWELAAHDYETAVELASNNAWLRMSLAQAYLEAGKLDEASRCLEQMAKANTNDELPELRMATIQLLRGDKAKYQAICERLLGRFEQAKNAQTANNVAWACSLAPDAVKDLGRAVRLAQRAVDLQRGNGSYLDTLGAVLYRANDLEGCISRLSQSSNPPVSSNVRRTTLTLVYDRLFLAMAHYRLGHVEEAEDFFEMVLQQLDTDGQTKSMTPTTLTMGPWQRRELNLLRAEAEKLIKPKR